jgi:probable HAF family extracellular repeat protein
LNLGNFGVQDTEAFGINSSGQVVGFSEVSTGVYRAFCTAPNSPITPADDLGTLGGTSSTAYGINDSGQVVGSSSFAGSTEAIAFRTAPNSPITSADALGTLGGPLSQGYAINNSGQVAGESETTTTYYAYITAPNGTINPATSALGSLGGRNSVGYGINDSGQVVGYAQDANDLNDAFRTEPNSPIDPATDNLIVNATARGINDLGQVVGNYTTAGGYEAFRTEPNSPVSPATDSLGTLGRVASDAYAINDSGEVVGDVVNFSFGEPVHAFVYLDNTMYDLNNLANVPAGWTLEQATAVNDSGQIVGWGQTNLDQDFGFLLTPVPEPSSVLLFIAGAMALAGFALRRKTRATSLSAFIR